MSRSFRDLLFSPARGLGLLAIRLYQRHVSPHKGYACAWRCHTGGASCSTLGYRAVRRHGLLGGLELIRQRTRRCGDIHRRHHPPRPRPLLAQRGDCDLPCAIGCDGPGNGGLSNICEGFSDCASCDWPSRKKDDRREA